MSILAVKVNCKPTDNFTGYRLFCSYTEKFSDSGEVKNGDSEWPTRPGLATCSILPSANKQQWLGEIDLPELADIEPSIVVQIKAQDGSITHEQVFKLSRETTSVELTSTSVSSPKLLTSSLLEQQATRLRGRVVDIDGQLAIAGQQLLLMVAHEAEGDERAGSDSILAATKTDVQGYFCLDFKSDVFSRASIKVANHAPQPIALVNGKLPKRVIISVAASAVTAPGVDKEGDCSCHTPVPMLPDAEDIINAPEVYTSDLSGGCVVLNKPNRTVEEFDFFGVVRTTEPDIVGFSLPEPQYLQSAQIREFGQYRPHRPGSSVPKTDGAPKGDTQPRGDSAQPAPKDPRSPQTAPTKAEPGRPPGRGSTLRTDMNPAPGASATTADGRPQPAGGITLNKLIDPRILKNIAKGRGYTEEVVAEAVKQTEEAMIDAAVTKSLSTSASRALLSASNPLDWDNEPTFYQAATVAHGHILHFKQIWKANGFSLGDLLYSLPLAPGQKRQVAVLDWERREIAARTESLEAEESLAANLTRDRDINEIVSASLKENVVGASLGLSASKGSSQGSSGPGSGDQSALSLVSGSAGGIGGAASVGFQHGSRQATATSLQKIRDRVGQAASAVRSQRSTVVQSVTQGETLRAQTEVIANYNHCHAITVEYFEVLKHFAVQHKLVDVQECLFVPLMMSPFDKQKALRWREPLQRALIDRRLRPAFDALERMEHNYDGADFPATTYADEPIKQIDGMLRVSFRLVRPGDKEGDEIAPDMAAWAGVAALTGINVFEFFNNQLKNSSNPDKAFLDALGKQIVEELIERVEINAVGSSNKRLPLQLELASEFKNRTPLQIRVRSKGALPANLTRQSMDELEIKILGLTAESSIEQILPPGTKVTLELMQLRYSTENIQHALLSVGRLSDNLIDKDGVSLPAPISQEELRNPRNEDRERVNALLRHLHDNIEHYHKAIWQGMDSSRRFMLLDGITAPNANGRSIASVVENRLIGIVGNSLVLPVVLGLQLDPVYQVDPAEPVSLLEVYQPLEETAPLLISVPTKGVYAESVMGSCNSCEKKDETRFWRWEESPLPDQPSPIGLLSTDSRQSATPDLAAKDFAQPIINLQNAPSAPDPSGLAAMMQLIGKGDSFRDLTGLNQNQLNAAAGLVAGMQSVGDASRLALQKTMMSGIGQLEEQVKRSVANGTLDAADGKKIMKTAYEKAVGAGVGEPRIALKLERDKPVRELETEDDGAEDVLELPAGTKPTTSFVTIDGDTPENRSFNPGIDSKTGSIKLEVLGVPSSAPVKWSTSIFRVPGGTSFRPQGTVSFDNANLPAIELNALTPGRLVLTCDAKASGLPISMILSVPLFVVISLGEFGATDTFKAFSEIYPEVTASEMQTFDSFISYLMPDDFKQPKRFSTLAEARETLQREILTEAKSTLRSLLSNVNVRAIWNMAPFFEKFDHLKVKPIHKHAVTLWGRSPNIGLFAAGESAGDTRLPFSKAGQSSIFLPFDNSSSVVPLNGLAVPAVGLSQALGKISLNWKSKDFSDDDDDFVTTSEIVVKIAGRGLASIIAHEIGHALIGTDSFFKTGSPRTNNHSWIQNDLMNDGAYQSFTQATGLELIALNLLPFSSSIVSSTAGTEAMSRFITKPSGALHAGSLDLCEIRGYEILKR